MVIQYLWLLMANLLQIAGEGIDRYFIHSISLEAIVIAGVIGSLINFFELFANWGIYYFRMYGNRAKGGLYLSILTGVLTGISGLFFAPYVTVLFPVEQAIEPVLINCLYIICLKQPLGNGSVFVSHYMILTGREKTYSRMLIPYYISMIFFDAVAVLCYKSIYLAYLGTVFCDSAYFLIGVKLSGIRKEPYEKKDIKTVFIDGIPLVLNRLCSKISAFLIDFTAVRFGTLSYAIVVVVRKGVEYGQQAILPLQTVGITRYRGLKIPFRKLMSNMKRPALLSAAVSMAIAWTSVFLVKGEIPLKSILPVCLVAVPTGVLFYIPYLVQEIRIQLFHKGDILFKVGLFRLILAVLLSFSTGIFGYLPLAFYSTVTDPFVFAYSLYKCR